MVDEPQALLIFPEGTLVTGNTRPKSLAFAEKLGSEPFRVSRVEKPLTDLITYSW